MNKIQINVDAENKIIEGYVDGCSEDLVMDIRKKEKQGLFLIPYKKEDLLINDSFRCKITCKEPDVFDEKGGIESVKNILIAKIERNKMFVLGKFYNKIAFSLNTLTDRYNYLVDKSQDFFEKAYRFQFPEYFNEESTNDSINLDTTEEPVVEFAEE